MKTEQAGTSTTQDELRKTSVPGFCLKKKFKKWYMHGTSHWLGLDVHDVGPYGAKGESLSLEPGMVLTIEPGLYVAFDDEQAPEEFRGMGIRIEDDILIAENGPINLTEKVPKTISEIEAIVGTA